MSKGPLRAVHTYERRCRRSTTPTRITLRRGGISRQNAGNQLKISSNSFLRCRGRALKNSGYPVSHFVSLSREIGSLTPYRQRIPPNLNGNPPRPQRPRNNRRRSRPFVPLQRRNLPHNPPPRPRRGRLGRSRHVPRPLRAHLKPTPWGLGQT